MAKLTVTVRDALWKEFSQTALLRRKNPQRLAERLLVEAMRRAVAEDLLRRTERAFHRSKVGVKEAEAIIQQLRTQHIADAKLMADSRRDARKAKIAGKDVEELIRQHRRKKCQQGASKGQP